METLAAVAIRRVVWAAMPLLFAACGGGGSDAGQPMLQGSGPTASFPNSPPPSGPMLDPVSGPNDGIDRSVGGSSDGGVNATIGLPGNGGGPVPPPDPPVQV